MKRQLRLSAVFTSLLLSLAAAMLFQTSAMAGEVGVSFYEAESEEPEAEEPEAEESQEEEPQESSPDEAQTTYVKKSTLPQTGEIKSSSSFKQGAGILGAAAWVVIRGVKPSFT